MLGDISDLRVRANQTVRETIAAIGANRRQIALVVDAADHLLGVVTDGDIRRGILRGVGLEDSAVEIMNSQPKVAQHTDSSQMIIDQMAEFAIRHMPVVDRDGKIIGLFMADEIHPRPILATPIVLMAGGKGQRLYPLTRDVPKPMLPIGGVPLLEIILRSLAAQGFINVYISVNYLADVIVNHVGDGAAWGLKVEYVRENKPLGTAGALAELAGLMAEPFIVMNSDLLTLVNLREMLSFHSKERGKATVGVREHLFEIPYGVVNLTGSIVESMVEKPLHRSLVNAGIYALNPEVLDLLVPGEYCDMPTLLDLIMSKGDWVTAFPIHESWLDVGRPEDLNQAQTDSGKWIQQ